ncbi:bifunctional tRNA (5-methylaminomethyl-2-thiouridine)(34)-methyltransferase MnmD/FAD-dependent 5-carboxymethylaminomethyl-2-thiouridine(34) oxidoreductase MnmC [Amphritea sp. 1_MG-2023]|uniref:bifunctional tRNA (5-methylaminomethyl-2-thiouridine)(34)-methyltransferase MnmD/FAD-dependent 5-carboxymethylaminomethyl-2-thiouridine(34) oxidoreductase MnmC n=1 Tax=Amphritea sp. 1_MG-2023 TaxID=3062670 RepID=UPI0026E25210|nr:bifunctional tRNA (5-methylaminomethyl-2-thiouridine)(34)-methyltransferase MnmD/FAD-dependent 5-carboxymethylaminomethyl-2-thiouridine(34) oxidoreductase MnmC [Amphritea sp. 1_MG-2023]MDO6564005.1 bifunctional tRNA (5-methylaminomethyl-2-thiouridine)(34)-methyltransferase MnmD/FAD-dependent 5-carboxymethylaminomethyl-2-thiouridine(34) oxidoreductase MnmC [Amphritea sp. 1_MG-2023]
MKKTTQATIIWNDHLPYSVQHEDIYFSTENGLEETNHVFLESNQLRERFATADSFTIAETGFGTGLNFLATWQLFREQAPASARLHFVSVEKYPIATDDLIKALALWPALSMFSEQLIVQYPSPVPGFHQLSFDQGRVTLTLMLGDAVDCYRQLDAIVDAWFFDGFTPFRNPDMWRPELFEQVGRLSQQGTTFSTFTCAGVARRGLRDVGFNVETVTGFGRKREMLIGTFTAQEPMNVAAPLSPAWFELPNKHSGDKTALIIGAGIAGCATAYALAKRGWKVTLVDKNPQIAAEGSGNHQGALYAKLPIEPIPASRFHLSGFLYSSRLLQQSLADRADIWSPCGLLQLAAHEKERVKHEKLAASSHYPASVVRYVEQAEATDIAGTAVNNSGLFFPEAGWVSPPRLCRWLSEQPNITVMTHTEIVRLEQQKEGWQGHTRQGDVLTAAVTVIAAAANSVSFEQSHHLPLQNIRGQVSITAPQANIEPLNTVLCSEGYISPSQQGRFCFGATFDLKDEKTDIRESGHQHNLQKITDMAPRLGDALAHYHTQHHLAGRVGFRCVSPDKLPMIGPVPIDTDFIAHYARLRHDAKTPINTPPSHYPGLFANLAHGSKGLISGLISGELIAAMLEHEPLPLEKELVDKLNPARFIIKNLIRRAI